MTSGFERAFARYSNVDTSCTSGPRIAPVRGSQKKDPGPFFDDEVTPAAAREHDHRAMERCRGHSSPWGLIPRNSTASREVVGYLVGLLRGDSLTPWRNEVH